MCIRRIQGATHLKADHVGSAASSSGTEETELVVDLDKYRAWTVVAGYGGPMDPSPAEEVTELQTSLRKMVRAQVVEQRCYFALELGEMRPRLGCCVRPSL